MPAVRRTRLIEFAWRFHRFLFRATGGRLGARVGRFRAVALTTTGRNTGAPRLVMLNGVEHERGWVVVASNAGEPAHPVWWLNLQAHPDATAQIGRTRERVRARELEGEARAAALRQFEEMDSGYRVYQERTTRPIPVILLERLQS